MEFPQKLRELRTDRNMTQKELANRVGLSPNSICEWEKGRCEPGISHLITLSNIFECSIDFLTGNSDDFGVISIQNEKSALVLSQGEKDILEIFNSLAPEYQAQILEYARYFAERTQSNRKKI